MRVGYADWATNVLLRGRCIKVLGGLMAYDALRKWADDYTKWLHEMANQRKECLACEQDAYLGDTGTDLEAAMMGTRADPHGGPYCKLRTK